MNDPTLNMFDQLAEKVQKALSVEFETRHATTAACGDVLKTTIFSLRDRGWKTHESILNAALFQNTVSYDLSIVVSDLVRERDVWKRRFIARSLALLLFEIGEDIPAVFGKKFRDASAALGVSNSQLNALDAETQKVALFWNEHRALLKVIRSIAAAHRDHDAIAIHETIDGIDLFDLLGLGIELGSMMNSLGAATQAIIKFTCSVEPPELNAKS